MKHKYMILALLIISTSLFAQSKKDWIKIMTSEVGLDDARGARIYINDINGDDYPDFIYSGPGSYKEPLHVMINEPNGNSRTFVDRTEESGINQSRFGLEERWSDVSVFGDIDNDGDNDLITGVFFYRLEEYILKDTIDGVEKEYIRDDQKFEVMLNDGNGNFTIKENNGLTDHQFVTETIRGGTLTYPKGLVSTTGMTLIDYNKDGNLDLVIGTFMLDYNANYKARQYLMEGNGDGSFTYVKEEAIEDVREPLYGLNSTDYNNDGWMDVVASPYCRSGGSIWQNNGNGTFTDVSGIVNYSANHMNRDDNPDANLCQWEAMPSDFDNDGDIDLLQVLVHGGYDEGVGRTTIAVNSGEENGFEYHWEIDRLQRIAPEYSHLGDMGANWFDLNNDGMLDVAIGQMSYPQANVHGQERLYILLQNEDHYFDDISYEDLGIFETMKEGHSMEPIDFDMDGDNDLIFSRQFRDTVLVDDVEKEIKYMKFYLMYNQIADSSNWTSVKITPPANSNKAGIGSRITVYSNGVPQIREILAGNGHFGGQDPYIKNFGLGKNDGTNYNRIDSIKVRWQDNETQITTIYNPPLNTFLNISPDGNYNIFRPDGSSGATINFASNITDFDTVYVDSIKKLQVELMNVGDEPLDIAAIELIDPNNVFTFQDVNTFAPIQPGSSINYDVTFQPNKRGIFKAALKVTSNATNKQVRYYDLIGYGFNEQPIISYGQNMLDFDSVYVGDRDTLTLNIINKGEKSLSLEGFELSDNTHFKLLDLPTEVVNLDNEQSYTIEVEFIPEDEQDYNSELTITSNAYNTEMLTYQISGFGELRKAYISANSSSVTFLGCEIGDTKTRKFTIRSEGTKELTIEKIFFDATTEGSFYIEDYDPPYVIEQGEELEFVLVFSPEEAIKYDGTMNIRSDAENYPYLQLGIAGIGREPSSVNDDLYSGKNIAAKIYPNPFTESITIDIISDNQFYQKGRIYIVDLNGNEVAEIEPYGIVAGITHYSFTPTAISSGHYFIRIETIKENLNIPIIYNR